MKYIFRYTLITQYTNNLEGLLPKDLMATLSSVNFTQHDKLEQFIETSRACIDSLIKSIGKNKLNAQNTKYIISQYFKQQSEVYVDELVQVWESEKSEVLGKILKQSCKSQGKFIKLNWQVNTTISNKRETAQDKSVVLVISSENVDKRQSKSTVQLRKEELHNMGEILMQATSFLDENLK